MCLEVKKNKRKFNSVCYYLASKLKPMWPCENPQKRRIVVQNGKQNEVAVITVSIEHAVAVKK